MFLETAESLKLSVSSELLDHLLPNGLFNSHNPKGIRFAVRMPLGGSMWHLEPQIQAYF